MQLFIHFLGTGGSWPSVQRNVAAVAVKRGGEIVLFDCGEGTQRQLQKSALSHMQVTKIFITHFHGDHFLGLPGFIQTLQLNDREDPLYIYGPRYTKNIVQMVLQLGYFKPAYDIIPHDLKPGDVVRGDGYNVRCHEACHNVPSLSYALEEEQRPGRFNKKRALELGVPEGRLFSRLQHGEDVTIDGGTVITPGMVLGQPRPGRKITITGDTRPCPRLLRLAAKSDVLIHDATFEASLEEKAHEYGHSTARQAAEFAQKAEVEQLILTHISPRYRSAKKLEQEAQEVFPNSRVADDFDQIEVKLKP
jgi:ribonuclease Z